MEASRAKRPPKAATIPLPSSPVHPQADAGSRVVLAAVAGAHGIAGEVKLKVFADDLTAFTSFNDGTLTLTSLRGPIARFAEIRDRTAAEGLRGTELTVPRAALPPLGDGEYYHADLIGLAVMTPVGEAVGQVVAVENFGAGDVIEVERPDGRRFMAPMSAVPEWNAERLVIDAGFVD